MREGTAGNASRNGEAFYTDGGMPVTIAIPSVSQRQQVHTRVGLVVDRNKPSVTHEVAALDSLIVCQKKMFPVIVCHSEVPRMSGLLFVLVVTTSRAPYFGVASFFLFDS